VEAIAWAGSSYPRELGRRFTFRQFFAQCIGTLTCFAFVFVSFYVFFKVLDAIIGNRVSAEVEIGGLDLPEMGALAYPEFATSPGSSYSIPSSPTPAGAPVTAKQAEAL
jgi:ammonia channel protein AmtB